MNSTQSSKRQQSLIQNKIANSHCHDYFDLLTSSELLSEVEAHLPDFRERIYPPTLALSMFLNQVLSADKSCQNAVNQANVGRILNDLSLASSNTGAYCSARKRLPVELIQSLVYATSKLMCDDVDGSWLWRNRHVKLVDGTTVQLPDTKRNQKEFPQHGNQSEGVGSPLARLVAITSLATGAVHDLSIGPYKGKGTGENALFRQISESLEESDILLGDSYYCSYFLIALMINQGVDVLFEQHGARKTDFRKGKRLASRDQLITWSKPARPYWMTKEEYAQYPDTIAVREVKVCKKILVTTLVNKKIAHKKALGELYQMRWHVELDLRNIKTTLGMETLSCKTPEMCRKEVWAFMLAYNLIRFIMAAAAVYAQIEPRYLSFKHTLQVWVAWNRHQFHSSEKDNREKMILMISEITVGKRPGRIEPRAVKKRPKPFPRLKESRDIAREKIRRNGHAKKANV